MFAVNANVVPITLSAVPITHFILHHEQPKRKTRMLICFQSLRCERRHREYDEELLDA